MKIHALASTCATVVIVATPAAQAATFVVAGTLSGLNEVPANASPGTGLATATFDDVTNILSVSVSFAGLLGTTTAAHIHCCALPGSNAGVATPVPSFPGFPSGVTAGSYAQSLDLTLSGSFNPAFVTANGGTVASARAAFVSGLLGGRTYFNIHTSAFPGGEIRANLTSVPEPASWATMIAGFGLVGGTLRARRREAAPA